MFFKANSVNAAILDCDNRFAVTTTFKEDSNSWEWCMKLVKIWEGSESKLTSTGEAIGVNVVKERDPVVDSRT